MAQCRRKLFSSASTDSKRAGIIQVLIARQDQGMNVGVNDTRGRVMHQVRELKLMKSSRPGAIRKTVMMSSSFKVQKQKSAYTNFVEVF